MESLYTKYRPQTFEDVVGQAPVVSTLERAVANQTLSHAYLFCGPRGTGKTTLARILAKALVCEEGPGMLPDGTCEQCRAVAEGIHPDVIEIDAASRTNVSEVREEIITKVDFAPVMGRSKVYIVDEVHMLSRAAFNALLKTLEEPPAHVTFIFCTTDPQKILPTVLSRLQRFTFTPLADEDIRRRLEFICEKEGYRAAPEALELVVRHARGGMRDAISTLEQLAVFGDGDVSLEVARDLLGQSSEEAITRLVEALAARDVGELFGIVAEVVRRGRDLQQLVEELTPRIRDLYVVRSVGLVPSLVDATGSSAAELEREAALFENAERLARLLQGLSDAEVALKRGGDQRLTLEIAFTKLARPATDLTLEALDERLSALEARLEGGGAPRATAPEPQLAGAAATVHANAAPRAPRAPAAPPRQAPRPAAQAAPAQGSPRVAVPAPGPAPAPAPNPPAPRAPAAAAQLASAPAPRPSGLSGSWNEVLASLPPNVAGLLSRSAVQSDDGRELVIEVYDNSPFTLGMLKRPDMLRELEAQVAPVFGKRRVEVVAAEGPSGDARGKGRAPVPGAPQAAPAPQAARPARPAGVSAPPWEGASGPGDGARATAAREAPTPKAAAPAQAQPASAPGQGAPAKSTVPEGVDESFGEILAGLQSTFGDVQVLSSGPRGAEPSSEPMDDPREEPLDAPH